MAGAVIEPGRESLLLASARAADLLLRERDLGKSVPNSLRRIGEAAGADRSYLFRCFYDGSGRGRASQSYEWNSGQAEPQIDNPDLQDVPFEALPEFFEPLERGEAFSGMVRDMPEDLRATLEPQGVKSLVALPVRAGGRLWGFVGFDACAEERDWTADERAILAAYAASLGAAVERAEMEMALRSAKELAEAADRAKTDFIANVSHEIRTPLNSILGFSELAAERNPDPQMRHYIWGIKTSGDSLLALVNNILDLSRLEAGRLEIRPEPVGLGSVLRELEAQFGPKARDRGIRLRLVLDRSLPDAVMLDRTRIRQILINILGFAVTYAEGPDLRIAAQAGTVWRGKAELSIAVECAAFGPDLLQAWASLDRPAPLGEAGAAAFSGAAIGLSISRKIAELMGGRLELGSGPSKGGSFHLVMTAEAREAEEEPQAGDADGVRFHTADVLVVSRSEAERWTIASCLSGTGLRARIATDGEGALVAAMRAAPALVILDALTPWGDALPILRSLKADASTSSIPVVAFAARSRSQGPDELSSLCDAVVEAPVERRDLLGALARFLPPERGPPAGEEGGRLAESPQAGDAVQAARRFSSGKTLAAELMSEWRDAARLESVDDVAEFAQRVKAAADRLGDAKAFAWAEGLADSCAVFDLPRMESAFESFPGLIGADEEAIR